MPITRTGVKGGFTSALPYSKVHSKCQSRRIVKNDIRDFKIPHRRRRRKRHLKSDFAFFETSGRLFQFANSAKCRRTLLNTNKNKNKNCSKKYAARAKLSCCRLRPSNLVNERRSPFLLVNLPASLLACCKSFHRFVKVKPAGFYRSHR